MTAGSVKMLREMTLEVIHSEMVKRRERSWGFFTTGNKVNAVGVATVEVD